MRASWERDQGPDPVYVLAGLVTLPLVASRFFPVSPLVDLATGAPAAGASLRLPWGHLLLTPFCALADWLTCNGQRQLLAFLALLGFGFAPFRFFVLAQHPSGWHRAVPAAKALGLYVGLCGAFLAAAIFLPRPFARIELESFDEFAVNFHGHTNASWDGRRGFTLEKHAAWHQAAGFAAGFVTDHNVHSLFAPERVGEFVALPGVELSLHDAHVLVYGARAPIERERYADGEEGLMRFLAEASSHGLLAVPSLPEYWRFHRDRLPELADAGAAGFELLSASPKGIQASDAARVPVAELCADAGLFPVSGTDNHGYGSAACAWTVLRLPNWWKLTPERLHRRIIDGLHDGKLSPRVVARRRPATSPGWWVALDPLRGLWQTVRTWTLLQCAIAALWTWGLAAVVAASRSMR